MALNQKGEPCSCDKVDCPRNGKCDECRAYHEQIGKPNACDKKAVAQENS